jgi:hypothetical protein
MYPSIGAIFLIIKTGIPRTYMRVGKAGTQSGRSWHAGMKTVIANKQVGRGRDTVMKIQVGKLVGQSQQEPTHLGQGNEAGDQGKADTRRLVNAGKSGQTRISREAGWQMGRARQTGMVRQWKSVIQAGMMAGGRRETGQTGRHDGRRQKGDRARQVAGSARHEVNAGMPAGEGRRTGKCKCKASIYAKGNRRAWEACGAREGG